MVLLSAINARPDAVEDGTNSSQPGFQLLNPLNQPGNIFTHHLVSHRPFAAWVVLVRLVALHEIKVVLPRSSEVFTAVIRWSFVVTRVPGGVPGLDLL